VQVIEIKYEQEKRQSQTQEIYFEVRTLSSMFPPSQHERFHYPQRIFHKEMSTKELYGLHKIGEHNSNTQSSIQDIAQSQ